MQCSWGELDIYLRLCCQFSEEVGVPDKPLICLKQGDFTKLLSVISKPQVHGKKENEKIKLKMIALVS